MRKISLTFCFLLYCLVSFGQIRFEKGYIIGQDGVRTECLIKNNEWANTPVTVKYKLPGSEETLEGNATTIKEFGFTNDFGSLKYIGATVQIDRSLDASKDIATGATPMWQTESLFLKELVGGNAVLYGYEKGELNAFFYAVEGAAPKQLMYKEYWTKGAESRIMYNKGFLGQLWADVKCPSTDFAALQRLRYVKKDLEKYFRTYNQCVSGKVEVVQARKKRKWLNLYAMGGLTYGNLISSHLWTGYQIDFKNLSGYRFGAGAEFVLPINKGRWSLLLEPTFDYASAEKDAEPEKLIYYGKVKMVKKMLEMPIGVRHYFIREKMLNVYLTAYYMMLFGKSGSYVSYMMTNGQPIMKQELDPYMGFAAGAGVTVYRFGGELRYNYNSNSGWGSRYYGITLTGRIRIF